MNGADKKRKKPQSEAGAVPDSEASQVQQPNLERRAAYYARADPKSLPSSTPTGVSNVKAATGSNQPESWPGPFATAHAMIQQREDAKKAREDAILAAANGTATSTINLMDMDEFDKFLHTLKWEPSTESRSGAKRYVIPALSDVCVKYLISHFNEIDESTFSLLSTDICAKFAIELCRQRKFSCEVAMQLAIQGSDGIFFPECSSLSDETFLAAMAKVSKTNALQGMLHCTFALTNHTFLTIRLTITIILFLFIEETSSSSASTSSLRTLRLLNCGHGFTDLVGDMVTDKHAAGLEILELTGCYRLNEPALCSLLSACQERLQSLDLSCNSRLGILSLTCITNLSALESLKLDNATPFTSEMLLPLSATGSALINLKYLSLAGLIDLNDAGFSPIIKRFGSQLRSLCVRGCVQLTDESIILVREFCKVLDEIDIGGLVQISTAALLGLLIEGAVQLGDTIVEIPILGSDKVDLDEAESNTSHTTHADSFTGNTNSKSIGQLSKVTMSGLPSSVTDDVIILLCQHSGSLCSLDVGGCSALTSRALSALLLHCSSSLVRLDVSFIRQYSEDSLGVLVDRCIDLKELSVWGCTQLTKRFFDGHRNDLLNIEGRMEA